MSLALLAEPQSASELAVMLCELEAHGIPAFVDGGHFASLFPGPQIPFYNTRRVMVPSSRLDDALEALRIFSEIPAVGSSSLPPLRHRLRIVLETFFSGWFIPGSRRRSGTTRRPFPKLPK